MQVESYEVDCQDEDEVVDDDNPGGGIDKDLQQLHRGSYYSTETLKRQSKSYMS